MFLSIAWAFDYVLNSFLKTGLLSIATLFIPHWALMVFHFVDLFLGGVVAKNHRRQERETFLQLLP